MVNAITGNIDATYYYDAYGNILESDGIAKDKNSILYSGYQYDEETGLYYLNARMYDPKIARFLQEDTYTGDPNDPLSLNLYVYCANNPLMYSDPTGHFWHIVGGALIGSAISAVIDVGSQMLIERKSFKSIDWKSVGVSALEGAVSGGLAAATGGASLAASAGKGVAKATGKQIIKKAVKTAVVEGVAGAAINAGAQKVVKGEVDWTEVAVSGASDAISGGLGSALPNTKLGQKLMDAGKSAKEKVGNVISSIGDSVKKQADTVKKQIDNVFSPKLAATGGIDIDVGDFDNSLKNVNLPKTEVQKNYNAIVNEAKAKPDVDVNPKAKVDVNAGVGEAGAGGITKSQYSKLRKKTPSQEIRDMVNPDGPKTDPVYGYTVDTLEADHIVPMKEITQMPGFAELTEAQQVEILNLADNFIGLGKSTNTSKGAKTWSQWQGHSKLGPISDAIRQKMLQLESKAKDAISKAIGRRIDK